MEVIVLYRIFEVRVVNPVDMGAHEGLKGRAVNKGSPAVVRVWRLNDFDIGPDDIGQIPLAASAYHKPTRIVAIRNDAQKALLEAEPHKKKTFLFGGLSSGEDLLITGSIYRQQEAPHDHRWSQIGYPSAVRAELAKKPTSFCDVTLDGSLASDDVIEAGTSSSGASKLCFERIFSPSRVRQWIRHQECF